MLSEYYNDQLHAFEQKSLNAEATLAVGEYEIDRSLDLNQSAALMKVISMVYNLEEAIIR